MSLEKIKSLIEDPEVLTLVSEQKVEQLGRKFKSAQLSYFEYLNKIGWGDNGVVIVYENPIASSEIYPNPSDRLRENIEIFADDGQGYCFGFDSKNSNRVVEISPKGEVSDHVPSDFIEFIISMLD